MVLPLMHTVAMFYCIKKNTIGCALLDVKDSSITKLIKKFIFMCIIILGKLLLNSIFEKLIRTKPLSFIKMYSIFFVQNNE